LKWYELLSLLALVLSALISPAQQTMKLLPEVISAPEPLYPPIARAARVSGVVHLHLTTDGKRVSAISEQTGPAMLIPASEAYVHTWIFAKHTPTAFDASFRYNFLEGSECETGVKLNPEILHLPTEVEINTAPYCDSVRFFRNKRILAEQHAYAVGLHIVYNGREVENPSEVVVTNSIQKNKSQSATLQLKDGLLLVPEAMANGSNLEIAARIGNDQIDIPGIPQSALGESWKIVLADKRKLGEYGTFGVPKGWNVRSSCLVEFEPLDGDGMGMAVSSCRKPVSK
jgi:hypothetical protein